MHVLYIIENINFSHKTYFDKELNKIFKNLSV